MRFDDFTQEARRVISQANAATTAQGHPQLTPAQLLLTLLDTPSTHAMNLWSYVGTQTATLRSAISEEVNALPQVSGDNDVYISTELLRIIEIARANSREAGAPATSTGHLLTALAAADGTIAANALNAAKCTHERIRAALRRVDNPENATPGQAPRARQSTPDSSASTPVDEHGEEVTWLGKFTIDLTERARDGLLDPVIGRDEEIRRLMEVLCRRRKNNPILVGEPGVGKTAIIEALARRLAEGDVPDSLRGSRLLSLDMGSLVAGAKLRGAFEERLKHILKEVREADGEVMLFIDEIHTLTGTGSSGGGGVDAASMLKPALARGELHAIGATTIHEYRQSIDRDAALARRFQTVLVEEPTAEQTLSILRGIKSRYEVHHGVLINDAALNAAVTMSSRYVSDRFLPDKAIDLIDEACSRLRLETDALPAEIDEVRRRIERLEVERTALSREENESVQAQQKTLDEEISTLSARLDEQSAQWKSERDILARIRAAKEKMEALRRDEEASTRATNHELAAEIRFGKLPEIRRHLATLEGELAVIQKDGGWLKEAIGAEEVAEIVAGWTGIPVTRLGETEADKLLNLEERLASCVIGQNPAVTSISNVIRRGRSGIQDPNRPLGSFLFLGPTGVGKTHLVKAVTKFLFDDPEALVRLDMSEYMEKHAVARLIGAPPGYVGYEEGGQLTEAVRRRPFSVVLLDEVEKAHKEVFDLLLQVLDDGRLTDSMGRTVSFTNTLIIMTSNLGSTAIAESSELSEEAMRSKAQDALMEFFRPELLNRIDEVVIFNRLSQADIKKIVRLQLQDLTTRLTERDLSLDVTEAAIEILAEEGYDPAFGARPVRRAIRKLIEDQLAVALISGDFDSAQGIRIDSARADSANALEIVAITAPASVDPDDGTEP